MTQPVTGDGGGAITSPPEDADARRRLYNLRQTHYCMYHYRGAATMKSGFALTVVCTTIAVIAQAVLTGGVAADEKPAAAKKVFRTSTVDFGIVVSDLKASIKFYTQVLGMKKAGGFKVAADFAASAGLTSNHPLEIVILKAGDAKTATNVKLMSLPGVKSKKTDNTFIHSQLGVSYLTLHINSTGDAMKRLKAAGVKPIAKGSVELPNPGVFLTIVRDPDGNLVELVGPK